jgi:hypothetical protein
MSTGDIVRWAKEISKPFAGEKGKPFGAKVQRLDSLVRQLPAMRSQRLRVLDNEVKPWNAFNAKHPEGGTKLADLMHASTLSQVDPYKYTHVAEALAKDATLKELVKNGSSKKTINDRRALIDFVYGLRRELDSYGTKKDGISEGQRIYNMVREGYQRTFDDSMNLIEKTVRDSEIDPKLKAKALDRLTSWKADVSKLEVYFPLMRQGRFWARVGKGKNAEFYLYRSAEARDKDAQRIVQELNTKGNTGVLKDFLADGTIDRGDDVASLRQQIAKGGEGASKVLGDIYDLIDSGGAVTDTEQLKDALFQMYMLTLPESDLRRRLATRKGITGFGADAVNNYITTQNTAAYQLARREMATPIRNAVMEMYDSMRNDPDKLRVMPFADEMAKRASLELAPSYTHPDSIDYNKLASAGTKAVFLWMLSSPKSALVNMTQVPIVGLPTLASKYGWRTALAHIGKYYNFFDKFGMTRTDENGEVVTKWGSPQVADSKYITEHKDPEMRKALTDAWNYFNNQDIYSATYAADMSARSRVTSAEYNGPLSRATRTAFNFMTGAFHQMESINRQIMSMAGFELEYKKLRAEGVEPEEAASRAQKEALKNTYESQFDFSQYEKARVAKSPLGRVAFQFMTYPYHMTSFLVRNGVNMLRQLPPAERREAAIKFFGTLGMTGLFAGVTGLGVGPISYSSIMATAEGVRNATRPADDDGSYDENDDGNPLGKRNLDLWFREWFLPHYFGPGGTVATKLGLSDQQAALLERGIKVGPISALTDLNFGTSVSLDNLWFRDDSPAQTHTAALEQAMLQHMLGPLGSLGVSAAGALDDFENGRGERGVEKLLPAFFRGPAVALREAAEGATTPNGDVIKPADWFTINKLLGQSIGFNSTEVADIQKASIMAKQLATGIEKEKAKILNQVDQAGQRYERNPNDRTEAEYDTAIQKVTDFSLHNPIPGLAITGDELQKSLRDRAMARARAINGLSLEPKLEPLFLSLVDKSNPQ